MSIWLQKSALIQPRTDLGKSDVSWPARGAPRCPPCRHSTPSSAPRTRRRSSRSAASSTRARFVTGGGCRLLASGQTLRGSFSAVWTATIATKYSFCSMFDDFSRSTRFSYFCTAQISKFQQKIVKIFGGMKKNHFI